MRNQTKIGRYVINGGVLTVYGVSGGEGTGRSGWTKEGYLTACIGLDQPWNLVHKVVVHEIFEWVMLIMGCGEVQFRFLQRDDSEKFHYHMTHEQMTEVTNEVSGVLVFLLPDIKKVHAKWHRH